MNLKSLNGFNWTLVIFQEKKKKKLLYKFYSTNYYSGTNIVKIL